MPKHRQLKQLLLANNCLKTRVRPIATLMGLAIGLSLVLSLSLTSNSSAATNSTINFQARLESSSGAIATDGTYNIEFTLYNSPSGGTALWT